jgi:hypothetical protein
MMKRVWHQVWARKGVCMENMKPQLDGRSKVVIEEGSHVKPVIV